MKKKLGPLKAIRKHCLWCMNEQPNEVRLCPTTDCPFYKIRYGKRYKGIFSLKAIRERCLDCMAGSNTDVRKCPHKDCELYLYRMGHNPSRQGLGGSKEFMSQIRP